MTESNALRPNLERVPGAPRRRRLEILRDTGAPALAARPAWFTAEPRRLVDGHGRTITYARVSIIDRCDLACLYCMPARGELVRARRDELLSFDELARIAALFARLGVKRLRFTGGEPLARRDAPELVRLVHARVPSLALAMTTNGTRLAELAQALASAGLASVNVSLDSLDPARFRELTRGGDLELVLEGIEGATRAGLTVKLNAVVFGDASVEEAPRLLEFAKARALDLRFIELMPVGAAAALAPEHFVPVGNVERLLEPSLSRAPSARREGPFGPARYRLVAGSPVRVGFVSALSEPFCASCNRIRLTARGALQACFGNPQGVPLGELLRRGAADLDLAWFLSSAIGIKDEGHDLNSPASERRGRVEMSCLGG